MQQTNDPQKALNGFVDPCKDSARLGDLRKYLRALPSLDFSNKGKTNICRRFGCTETELAAAVAGLQGPRPNAPTPELLRVIGAAVGGHQPNGKGVAIW